MPLNLDRLHQQLSQLEIYIKDLEPLKDKPQADFTLRSDIEAIAERRIYKAIQAALDIAIAINSGLGLGAPKTYRDIILNLKDKQILTDDLSQKLVAMVGMRNILAHEYATIDPQQIYQVIQTHYQDLIDFAASVSYYLSHE